MRREMLIDVAVGPQTRSAARGTLAATILVLLAGITAGLALDDPHQLPEPPATKPNPPELLARDVFTNPMAPAQIVELMTRAAVVANEPPWRKLLRESLEGAASGSTQAASSEWTPQFSFFPAEAGRVFFWCQLGFKTAPATAPKVFAMLRQVDSPNGDFFVLGTDKIPFQWRTASDGGVLSAARDLEPGEYWLAIAESDADDQPHLKYVGKQRLPNFGATELRLSSIVLADTMKQQSGNPGPFQVGEFDLVPRLTRTLHPPDAARLAYVVLGAGAGATGSADFDVSYQLHGKLPGRDWQAIGQPQVLAHRTASTQAFELPISAKFPAADYKIEIRVRDNVNGNTTSADLLFAVQK